MRPSIIVMSHDESENDASDKKKKESQLKKNKNERYLPGKIIKKNIF